MPLIKVGVLVEEVLQSVGGGVPQEGGKRPSLGFVPGEGLDASQARLLK